MAYCIIYEVIEVYADGGALLKIKKDTIGFRKVGDLEIRCPYAIAPKNICNSKCPEDYHNCQEFSKLESLGNEEIKERITPDENGEFELWIPHI